MYNDHEEEKSHILRAARPPNEPEVFLMNLPLPLLDQVAYITVLLLGLAICFFGYRLLRFWLALAGLQTGFYLGLWLGGNVLDNKVLILVVAVLCGILLAGLFVLVIKAGGFLAGAGAMVLLAALAMRLLQLPPYWYVLLVALLIGGILGVLTVKPFLILATAFNGAWLAADSVAGLLGRSQIAQYIQTHSQIKGAALALLLIGVAVLMILGALWQFRMERKRGIRAKSAEATAAAARMPAAPLPPAAANDRHPQPAGPAADSADQSDTSDKPDK